MNLKAACDVEGTRSILAPSPAIDEVWHKHLLDTKSYKMLENVLLPNCGFIHHNPFEDEQDGYPERLEYTRLLYQDRFLAEPPKSIWGCEAELQDVGNDLVESNSKPYVTIFVKSLSNTIITMKCYRSDKVIDVKYRIMKTLSFFKRI